MSRRKLQGQSTNAGSLRLRRLTQAYLTPYHDQGLESKHPSKLDELYSIGSCYKPPLRYSILAQHLIMKYQSVTTGLFPRYSKETTVGYVKDTVYCAMACWACSLAYKYVSSIPNKDTF